MALFTCTALVTARHAHLHRPRRVIDPPDVVARRHDRQEGQQKAVIADSIRSAELADIQGHIKGVPPTDPRYNTKEASEPLRDDLREAHGEETPVRT